MWFERSGRANAIIGNVSACNCVQINGIPRSGNDVTSGCEIALNIQQLVVNKAVHVRYLGDILLTREFRT